MHATDECLLTDGPCGSLPAPAAEEIQALRQALRDCRERLHRGALESTRRICALTSEVTRLENLNSAYRRRLESLGSDDPLIEMARRLVESRAENEALRKELRRVGTLEKALREVHSECSRMASERDGLLMEMTRLQQATVVV
jgi:predicted RNase H-like nuclease (RuvC/YqgF family)